MLHILRYGDPALRKKSGPVEKLNAAVRRLAEQMIKSMRAAAGVGLAAPQVGRNLRIAVVHHAEFQPKPLILINPVILERSNDLTQVEEGCLSVPHLNVAVARSKAVRVRYRAAGGETVEREFHDLMARIVQHECDHLEGKMIVDHLDLQTRLRFEAQLKKANPGGDA
ncbi:MAG: peptide deformylase [Candidatus Lindowbacteria bacterium RIFCSPLOWO2_12_FULL_62_27]|nr:MAG: peptide deformylase [Candidatus Lindowbacteria bacterium RIFCSPLOWO2_12_FULL_62_27]OGH58193.1 MAG: peptide deformylase [Candidatus Lindowbacteria bacterium RIFCSPLOWO2_02_FULL_62_12]